MATDIKKESDPKKDSSKKRSLKGKQLTNDEIYTGFQLLRNEQRGLAGKLSEMELDLNEHKIVIDTLKDLDGDRKCYRMVGGVLCEKTVKDVLPSLITNRDQLTNVIESLTEQLTKKGVEINEYKEKHNIRVRGHEDTSSSSAQDDDKKSDSPARNVIMVNPI